MAPIGKGYRECKLGAVYEASVDSSGEVVARNIEHVATMGNSEAIGDRVYCAAFRRGVERAGEVVVVADGGRWIWKQARQNFPRCVADSGLLPRDRAPRADRQGLAWTREP